MPGTSCRPTPRIRWNPDGPSTEGSCREPRWPRLPRCASALLEPALPGVSPARCFVPRTLDASDDRSPLIYRPDASHRQGAGPARPKYRYRAAWRRSPRGVNRFAGGSELDGDARRLVAGGRPSGRTNPCRHGCCLFPARQHHHARANLDAGVQVRDVLVGEPDAARGYEGPDGGRLIGAVNAINGVTEIKRARAERVTIAAGHEARKVRLALDHLLRWIPIGPFRLPGNSLRAGPGEALAADANPVAKRLALAEHEIEIGVRRIDDDRAGRLLGVVVDQRAPKLRRQFLPGTGLRPHLGRQRHHVTRIAITRIDMGRSGCVPWCGGIVKFAIGIEWNGLVQRTLRRWIRTGRIVLCPRAGGRPALRARSALPQ